MKNKLRKKRVKVKKQPEKLFVYDNFKGRSFYTELKQQILLDYYKAENKAFYGHR